MDTRHIDPAEHTVYESLRAFLAAEEYPAGVLTVMDGGLPIDIRHEPHGHDTTVVFFHTALGREQARLPVFTGAGISNGLPVNRVFVADPSLYIDDSLGLAWYAGNRRQPKLQWVIRRILRELVPDTQHAVMFGASGGGFAALYYAAHHPGAIAVPVNPQINIENYWPRNVQAYVRIAWGLKDISEMQKTVATTDVAFLYKHRPDTQVLYVQNRNDALHMEKHFRPFMDGLPPEHRVEPVLFDGDEGHRPPPKAMLTGTLQDAVERASRPGDGTYDQGMPTATFADLATARTFNDGLYGGPAAARELADDNGWTYCEACRAVFMQMPDMPNDGHECLREMQANH